MVPIPGDSLVVRGGRNQVGDIERGLATHPSGISGVSVECAHGLTIAELSAPIPHGQVGVTTVGAVRSAGGDVIRTSGRSPNHATLTGLPPGRISELLTPARVNPALKR